MQLLSTLSRRLFTSRAGEPVSFDVFVGGQMGMPTLMVLMAIEYVRTRRGAERIYRAELSGHKRRVIIAAASRRMDDFDKPRIPRGE